MKILIYCIFKRFFKRVNKVSSTAGCPDSWYKVKYKDKGWYKVSMYASQSEGLGRSNVESNKN